MLASIAYKVTCTGKIGRPARAKLGEKGITVVSGGSGPSGRRYTLRPVKAKDVETRVSHSATTIRAMASRDSMVCGGFDAARRLPALRAGRYVGRAEVATATDLEAALVEIRLCATHTISTFSSGIAYSDSPAA